MARSSSSSGTKSVLERAREAADEKFRRRVTLAEIAKLAGGISQPSVSEWRQGKPRIEHAVRFAVATGVCVEWLYTGREPKRPWDTDAAMDPLLAELRQMWERLNETGREELVKYARYLDFEHGRHEGPRLPFALLPNRHGPNDGGSGGPPPSSK